MGFLRPKVKTVEPAAAPAAVASPSDLLNSLARLRRAKGGRNSFGGSQTSSVVGAAQGQAAAPNTLTGVNG